MTEQTDLIEVVADWIDDFDGVAPINRRKQLLSARSLLAKLAENGVVRLAPENNDNFRTTLVAVNSLLPEDK